MKKHSIAIIGNGVMGQAIARNLPSIFIVKKNQKCPAADIVILAVKPQDFLAAARQLGGLKGNQLVISIMAGISLARLQSRLRHKKVVRAMPNLAARIGQSFTVWKTGKRLSVAERRQVAAIFSSLGEVLEVKQESYIDKATAISGSGPAYLYYFIEAMIKSAEGLGFSQKIAKQMVDKTFNGALAVYSQSGEVAAAWRERVTSKKGTTAAAIKCFVNAGFKPMVESAVRAAYKRSKELAKGKSL